jgi:hypothetical protein
MWLPHLRHLFLLVLVNAHFSVPFLILPLVLLIIIRPLYYYHYYIHYGCHHCVQVVVVVFIVFTVISSRNSTVVAVPFRAVIFVRDP